VEHMRQYEPSLIVMRLELVIQPVPANQAPAVLHVRSSGWRVSRKVNPHISDVAPLNLSFVVSMTIVISLSSRFTVRCSGFSEPTTYKPIGRLKRSIPNAILTNSSVGSGEFPLMGHPGFRFRLVLMSVFRHQRSSRSMLVVKWRTVHLRLTILLLTFQRANASM